MFSICTCTVSIISHVAETDLNLVRTFLRLYETRSVTRTAEQMSLTQPSVSHALRRLRKQFNDNLFSRSSGGLEPTERSRQVYPLLRQAIEAVEATMTGVAWFDPETARRTFHLQATDLGEISLLPPVLALVAEAAPGVDLHVAPLNVETAATALRQGHTDAVLATTRITADDISRQALVDDVYCGIRSATHPRIAKRPTLEDFLAERHIAVEALAEHTNVDESLDSLGHTRDIALRISHFAALPGLVAQTSYLSIIPTSVAPEMCSQANIETFELPFAVPELQVSLHTYRRALPDPGVEWFRETIIRALRDWKIRRHNENQ